MGEKTDSSHQELFVKAIQSGNEEEFKNFIERTSDFQINKILDEVGQSFIHLAIIFHSVPALKFVLEHGADADLPNTTTGDRPIHYAAGKASITLIRLLIEHGCDSQSKNKNGCTSLHTAAQAGSKACVLYLLSIGLDPASTDSYGLTPLMYSVINPSANIECTQVLLSFFPDNANNQDVMGNTALSVAIASKNFNTASFLIEYGYDIMRRNHANETPMDLALKYYQSDIIHLLEREKWNRGIGIKNKFLRRINTNGHQKYLIRFLLAIFPLSSYLLMMFENPFFNMLTIILNLIFTIFIVNKFKIKTLGQDVMFGLAIFPLIMMPLLIIPIISSYSILAIFMLLTIINYVNAIKKAHYSDPGYIFTNADVKKHTIMQFSKDESLIQECSKICSTCLLIKPVRSKHCKLCDKCVHRFDHHCPWVANCIGLRNYGSFFYYNISVFVLAIIVLIYFYYTSKEASCMAFADIRYILSFYECDPRLLFVLFLSVIFFIFSIFMIITMLYLNTCLGVTSNEYANYHRYDYMWPTKDAPRKLIANSLYNQGLLKNIKDMCMLLYGSYEIIDLKQHNNPMDDI